MTMYNLIDTATRQTVATAESEADALANTPYLPADCVPDRGDGEPAATWQEVAEVARRHADGIPGVVEGYAVELDREPRGDA